MQLEIVTLSKAGGRKTNEDACEYSTVGDISCCILSDGLGGHEGGAIASQLTVEHVLNAFRESPQCSIDGIKTLMHVGNEAVLHAQKKNSQLKSMRTTAVILTIDVKNNQACWGNIGDSRLYCFRQGCIAAQTRDHSVSQMMVDAGYLKSDSLRFSPGRNQLFAAMGDKEHFEFDTVQEPFSVYDADVFLLCSDGLWEYVEEKEMEKLLQASHSAKDWMKALETRVLELGNADQDNYSAVIVWCGESDEKTQIMVNSSKS